MSFFGAERSLGEGFYLMASDMHEHLGQAIAYARMNHVVPPGVSRDRRRYPVAEPFEPSDS